MDVNMWQINLLHHVCTCTYRFKVFIGYVTLSQKKTAHDLFLILHTCILAPPLSQLVYALVLRLLAQLVLVQSNLRREWESLLAEASRECCFCSLSSGSFPTIPSGLAVRVFEGLGFESLPRCIVTPQGSTLARPSGTNWATYKGGCWLYHYMLFQQGVSY